MTSPRRSEEIIQEIQNDPQLAAQLRAHILGTEFLQLPTAVRQSQDQIVRLMQTQLEITAETRRNQEATTAAIEHLAKTMADMAERFDRRLTAVEQIQQEMAASIQSMNLRQDRMEQRQDRMEQRLEVTDRRIDSIEGRLGNLEGSDYERKVRYRVLSRAESRLGLRGAYLALTQNDPMAPQLTSAFAQATRDSLISRDESEDLQQTDIIISGRNNHHVVAEVALTADNDDILRASRRAGVMRRITGGTVSPVVVTATLNVPQRDQAAASDVDTFLIAYP